ncbi:MAG: bifunctional hydroxymethylpyrimidine kinase/phosphomethylpyrimidine kinase, partial [Lachnospiraceae bacterium]|nr:bifunctional hydroxymethylpyrimidine kinase/phosphomethylpyrimidine kinase [Lachnospiraceae bacterium]
MGLQACPMPTAVLSAQTGFESYFYDDYTDRMNLITDQWTKMQVSFAGICSGYLGSAGQIKNLLYFLEKFHAPDTIFLADPVMGDNGRCIKSFSQELLLTMRELVKRADVITPNLTELCLLAGLDYDALHAHSADADYLSRVAETACKLFTGEDRLQTI